MNREEVQAKIKEKIYFTSYQAAKEGSSRPCLSIHVGGDICYISQTT